MKEAEMNEEKDNVPNILLDEGRELGERFEDYLVKIHEGFHNKRFPAPLRPMALGGFRVATGRDIAGWHQIQKDWMRYIDEIAENPQSSSADELFEQIPEWVGLFQKHLVFAQRAPMQASRFFQDRQSIVDAEKIFAENGVKVIEAKINWLKRLMSIRRIVAIDTLESDTGLRASLGLYHDSDVRGVENLAAVEVVDVRKTYGDVKAIDGITFSVDKGEIFGLLGPNGAGKTTLIECLEGIRTPDSGEIIILGETYAKKNQIREKIGLQLQSTGLFPTLTVKETLSMYISFFKKALPIDNVIAWVNLAEKSSSQVRNLSGGQYQRLSLAIALVNDPDVLFLDEPTTGLDPRVRRDLWDIILAVKNRGKTVFLTTHYMDEAERLCDRLAVVDRGRIIELGTPDELIRRHIGEKSIEFTYKGNISGQEIAKLPGLLNHWIKGDRVIVVSEKEQEALSFLLKEGLSNTEIGDIIVRRGTLEDVFLKLTNRGIES
ncbi:MAG: ABC transporter ATP-binding protein [Actinomycetota bacterium]|nr:ABC transporter ATP-binding protein [Actinomycetota bacterium]